MNDLRSAKACQQMIDQIRERFGYDFASLALARSGADGYELTWQYVSGNLNNRYKRIVLQSGRGVAGIVYKTGKPMLVASVDDDIEQQDLYQYPIVVSERLHSLGAIPLYEQERVTGVLLAGFRDGKQMTQESLSQLQQWVNGQFGAFVVKGMPSP